jgi:cardiolipin synthase
VSDRVVTVPNALSLLRLLGVPLFGWLLLGPHLDAAAFGVLGAAGISDYLDGRLARAFDQTSRLGQLLDPAADRLYVLVVLVTFAVRGFVPVWFAVLLLSRDLILAPTIPLLRRHGYAPLPVSFLGKAATLNLLYAFPLLLLARLSEPASQPIDAIAWGFAGWGLALYWLAGSLYLVQTRRLVGAAS